MRMTRRGGATCRSRSPATRRGFPTMHSSRGWRNGRLWGTRGERAPVPPRRGSRRHTCGRGRAGLRVPIRRVVRRWFVGASAGSGKTKLLTDRLLRLMLAGAAPERIQCLTFTKAAAAEMAVRLQKTLGRWVTLDDTALARELRALEVNRRTRRCATRARCSQACWTCRAACASAPSTRSASRCCGVSRWRRRCRRISGWWMISTPRTR